MARIVSLECDKCGLLIRNDVEHIHLFKRKVVFNKYDICKRYGDDEEIYLCGNCTKKFRKWLKEQEAR